MSTSIGIQGRFKKAIVGIKESRKGESMLGCESLICCCIASEQDYA